MPLSPDAILLRAPNWLGDCIMALPAVEALRRRFPEARLDVACPGALGACFENAPGVNDVIASPRARGVRGFLELWSAAGHPRDRRYDLGILLTNSFSTALWMWRGKVARRIGFARDGRSRLLTVAEPVTPALAAAHQSDYYLHLVAVAGGNAASTQPRLVVPDAGRAEAARLLERLGVAKEGASLVVIAPTSAYGPVKDWLPERYAALAVRLRDERNAVVLLAGTPNDREACGAMADRAGDRVYSLAGETSLAALFGVLERADAFVGGDSGGAHAAAALGKPTAVIFGITEPGRTRPLGERVVCIGKGGEETPDLKSPRVRAAARAALAVISVDEVAAALASVWPDAGAAPSEDANADRAGQ